MGRSNPSVRTAGAQRGVNPFLDGAFASPNKKSTLAPSPNKSRNPSPKKQQRMAEDALRQEEAEAKAALAQIEGMLANFEIEAAAHAAKLRQRKAEQLALFERKWKSAVAQMDDHLRTLTVADFFDNYDADTTQALSQIVHQTVRKAPLGNEELAQRAGKRSAPGSPRGAGEGEGRAIGDVFGTGKKARSGVAESGRKGVPGSAVRGAAARAKANATSPTAPRTTRARSVQASTSRPPAASSSRTRASTATFSSALPPTPSVRSGHSAHSTASRRPRRGESIITQLYSVNGSPLGTREVQYGEDGLGGDGSDETLEEEGEGEDGEWDFMSAGEASRVEEQGGKSAKKGKGKGVMSSSSKTRSGAGSTVTSPISRSTGLGSKKEASAPGTATRVPSASRFAFEPPKEAPSFEAILRKQLEDTENPAARAALRAMFDQVRAAGLV